MSDHIPDPGQHRTLFYGEYSSRVRGAAQSLQAEPAGSSVEPPPRRRCSASWARLIAKVYQVDPLLCVRCGQRMSILAFVSDQHSINRILDHLGLRAPLQDKPPPAREILRHAEQGEGWGVPASWE
jgi:hypothetical protein